MKIKTAANGQKILTMTHLDWAKIGASQGWLDKRAVSEADIDRWARGCIKMRATTPEALEAELQGMTLDLKNRVKARIAALMAQQNPLVQQPQPVPQQAPQPAPQQAA